MFGKEDLRIVTKGVPLCMISLIYLKICICWVYVHTGLH